MVQLQKDKTDIKNAGIYKVWFARGAAHIQAPGLTYNNLFRIIMRFIDAFDFDVRAIKKSCVPIVHKDGRIIPFETMNLFYRDEKETYLKQLQQERAATTFSKGHTLLQ